MQIHRDPLSFRTTNPVVTIGIFDGVHLGHDFIIRSLCQAAFNRKGSSVIVTLWPHPREVLDVGQDRFRLLNTLEEKISLLEKYGIDHLIIFRFSKEFSRLSAEDFVRQILVEKIGISHLLVGYNHRFGRDREGDYDNLQVYARNYSFSIERLAPLGEGRNKISSSGIREMLMRGDIIGANELLGYRYFFTGSVKGGNKVGRMIGFPTANIQISDELKLIPSDGVYVVKINWNDRCLNGMMNIGFRPTVNDNPDNKTMEVNIFDFEEVIYGHSVRIEFVGRLRDEMKFDNISSLERQLKIDREHALQILHELGR